jgi:serine/threonine protein phosphatase PrpC
VNGDWVVARPDTCSMSVDEGVEYVIVVSDGLWDSFKGEICDSRAWNLQVGLVL